MNHNLPRKGIPSDSASSKNALEMNAQHQTFDDTATKMMADAFDTLCQRMDGIAYSDVIKEIIAKRIIEIAAIHCSLPMKR